jgi:hypothetical protein
MMSEFKFGQRSLSHLITCHDLLQVVLYRAIIITPHDFTILCGRRGKEAQNEAFANGFSTKQWPDSEHNVEPPNLSNAADIAPWVKGVGIPWKDDGAFYGLVWVIKTAAKIEGVEIRALADRDRDGLTKDQTPWDLGHIELYGVSRVVPVA